MRERESRFLRARTSFWFFNFLYFDGLISKRHRKSRRFDQISLASFRHRLTKTTTMWQREKRSSLLTMCSRNLHRALPDRPPRFEQCISSVFWE